MQIIFECFFEHIINIKKYYFIVKWSFTIVSILIFMALLPTYLGNDTTYITLQNIVSFKK